ncbi:MAG: membrane dipeptidase [Clostridia bacterium]|nr:membrane dipeptidase [Clostridia bacterium]
MIICDTHCDTLYTMAVHPERQRDVTPETLRRGGVSLQTLAMFVGSSPKLPDIRRVFSGMKEAWEGMKASGARQALSPREAAEGECRFMLSVEGCDLMADGMEVLDQWHDMGVRMAALTWNYPNALATPHCVDAVTGLTPFGRDAVRKMQALGIACDVSHLNERGFWDLLEMGAVPLASHSCCRALCSHTRNLTDEQLKKLFGAGGYVGVNFYPAFLKDRGEATTADIADHLEHMMEMGGEGKIGFGSDFDGISRKPLDLKDPSELPGLTEILVSRFGEDCARGIAGKNLIDYYARAVEKQENKI